MDIIQKLQKAVLKNDSKKCESLLLHCSKLRGLYQNKLRSHSWVKSIEFYYELGKLLHMTHSTEIVPLLLTHGADINSRWEGHTLLTKAVRNAPLSFITFLLELGADVNKVDLIGHSPLHYAVEQSCFDQKRKIAILNHRANLNVQEMYDKYVTHKIDPEIEDIKCTCSVDIIKELLKHGANANLRNSTGKTCLHHALEHDAGDEIIKALLEHGADVNDAHNVDHVTPLHIAVDNSFVEAQVVKTLIESGATVNTRNFYGATPLHLAIRPGFTKIGIVQHLLSHRANVDAKNDQLVTPLHVAAYYNPFAIPILLPHVAHVEARNANRDTALLLVVQNYFVTVHIVKELLKFGANSNALNTSYKTPLHYVVEDFFKFYASGNCKVKKRKRNPEEQHFMHLHYIGYYHFHWEDSNLNEQVAPYIRMDQVISSKQKYQDQLEIMNELLKYGADVHTEDLNERSPWKIAYEKHREGLDDGSCLKLLMKYSVLDFDDQRDIYYHNPRCPIGATLSVYFHKCLSEVTRLQNINLGVFYTLYDVVSGRKRPNNLLGEDFGEKTDQILEMLFRNEFPIYGDVISVCFGREYLAKKFVGLRMSVVVELLPGEAKKEIFLNYCILYNLARYLRQPDLLNCVLVSLHSEL